MEMEIVERPEFRVAGVRHVGPYHDLQDAFAQLGAIAGAAGLFAQPDAAVLGVYHDAIGNVPQEELRSDAAVTLPDGAPAPEGLREQQLPGGRYATAVHEGSYAHLQQTWSELMRAIDEAGHQPRQSACYEIYRNAPGQVPEDELRTEIFVPIQ